MQNIFKYSLDKPVGSRANIGLVTLQSDETIESDMRRYFPENDVALYVSRVASAPEVSADTLAMMEAELPKAARLLPPPVDFDVVGYGCTSGTSVIGAEKVTELISSGCNTLAVTDPLTALIAACKKLKISQLGFLSPYIAEVSLTLRNSLKKNGVNSLVFGSFDEAVETRVARISGGSIIDACRTLCNQGPVEGIFLSCTNLQTIDVIEEIEELCRVPVLSSNQVLAWHMRTLSSLQPSLTGVGRLMK
ncbi:MAG: Asp/Glu racemase [Paracoccaceae bacterium]|nr:Asp/Glu racemase [Paracoccaceae bacterium]